jgi:hypothetical protein
MLLPNGSHSLPHIRDAVSPSLILHCLLKAQRHMATASFLKCSSSKNCGVSIAMIQQSSRMLQPRLAFAFHSLRERAVRLKLPLTPDTVHDMSRILWSILSLPRNALKTLKTYWVMTKETCHRLNANF